MFPLNQTVIFSVSANKPYVSLNIDKISGSMSNATVIIYLRDLQSANIENVNAKLENNSTMILNVLDIENQIRFGSSFKIEANQSSTAIFNVDSIGGLLLDTKIEFDLNDNSSGYVSLININTIQILRDVSIKTNSSTSNQTQNNFSFLVREVYNLTINATVQTDSSTILKGALIFDNVEQGFIRCNLIFDSSSSLGTNDLIISFQNINNLLLPEINMNKTSQGDVKLNLTEISTFSITNAITFNLPKSQLPGSVVLRVEQIDTLIMAGSFTMSGVNPLEFYLNNVGRAQLGSIVVNSQGGSSLFLIDQVSNLTLTGGIILTTDTPSSNKLLGSNNMTISNVQNLKTAFIVSELSNGASSVNIVNVGQLNITSNLTLIFRNVNSTYNLVNTSLSTPAISIEVAKASPIVNFGPNIRNLYSSWNNVSLNDNTSSLDWNLKNYSMIVLNVLTGRINGLANMNFINDFDSSINNIYNTFNALYGSLFFNMFGTTNYFYANGLGVSPLVQIVNKTGCTCQNISPL